MCARVQECVCKEYCSLERSFVLIHIHTLNLIHTYTSLHLCSSPPVKPRWCVFHVLSSPFLSSLRLFLLLRHHPSPTIFLSLLLLPFFLSFWEGSVCKCQHFPIYLPEPRATSCSLCLPPQRCPIGTAFFAIALPPLSIFFSSSTSSHFLFPNSIFYCPHSDHAILSHLFYTALLRSLHLNSSPLPSQFHFLHHSCFTHVLTLSLRPHPLLFMDHGTFIGVTSWHFQCWLRLVHQVFWLKSTAITPSIDSFWIYFQMRVRVCSCLTHRITKHLIPLSIILKCLFLSPFALLLIFLSPHIHLPPVVLYPSLYLSIITVMTHVAHTCSAVKGGLREGVAFHRLTDIKSLHNEGFGRVSLCIFLTPWPFFKFALWFGLEDRVQATI